MAKQVVTVTMDDGSWSFSHSASISDADMTRVIAGLQAQYGPVGIGGGATRLLTPQECFGKLLAGMRDSITAAVTQHESAAAQSTEVAAVSAIVPPAWS